MKEHSSWLPASRSETVAHVWDVCPVLEVWVFRASGVLTIVLSGALTAESAAQVRLALAETSLEADPDLVIDMQDVDTIDAAGLGVLAGALRRSGTSGVRLQLRSPSRPVLRALEASGLAEYFPLVHA